MSDEVTGDIPEGCRVVLQIYSDDDCKKVLGIAKVRKMNNQDAFEFLKRAVKVFEETYINPPAYRTPDKYANEPNDFVEWLKKPKDKE